MDELTQNHVKWRSLVVVVVLILHMPVSGV
jgi:hypothetical protein